MVMVRSIQKIAIHTDCSSPDWEVQVRRRGFGGCPLVVITQRYHIRLGDPIEDEVAGPIGPIIARSSSVFCFFGILSSPPF